MSKLENFKGRIYTLTLKDRRKGGKVSSRRKASANALKNLKHGRNTSNHILLLRCSDCPFIFRCDKMHDGYCTYLLEEMKDNKKFFRQVNKNLHIEDGSIDLTDLVRKMYQMNKRFIELVEEYATEQNSDSNG